MTAVPLLTERFDEALAFTSALHRHQRRKRTDIPYVSHLLAVAALVIEHGGTEDQAIAALLHDAVEDQGGMPTRMRIQERFGETVANLVMACSDTHEIPKPPWQARKEAYIASIVTKREDALLITAADKLHNCRSIVGGVRRDGLAHFDRFKGGVDGTLWYYRKVLDALIVRGYPPIADIVAHLRRAVEEMEALVAEAQAS